MEAYKIIFLGTGANGGIPEIGCDCYVCRLAKNNLFERRFRSSIAIKDNNHFIIFDCGPDIRQQMINNDIDAEKIKAIFITHTHYDHIGGLLEFCMGKRIPIKIYTDMKIINWLIRRFETIDKILVFHSISNYSKLKVTENIYVSSFYVPHTSEYFGPTLGYEILVRKDTNYKRIVYIPDFKEYTNEILDVLSKADIAIIDGTFFDKKLYNHVSILEGVKYLKNLHNLTKVFFIHINHTEGTHRELVTKLLMTSNSNKFNIAYDSLIFNI